MMMDMIITLRIGVSLFDLVRTLSILVKEIIVFLRPGGIRGT